MEKKTFMEFVKENRSRIVKGVLIVGGLAVGAIIVKTLVDYQGEKFIENVVDTVEEIGETVSDGIEAIGDAATDI